MTEDKSSNTRQCNFALGLFWLALLIAQYNALPSEFWESPLLSVQDDGRHFVVWLRSMADKELFVGDPVAAYFGALTPIFYKALFQPAIWFGVDVVYWQMLVISPLCYLLTLLATERFFTQVTDSQVMKFFAVCLFLTASHELLVVGLPRSFSLAILFFALAFFLSRQIYGLALVFFIGANIYPIAAITAGGGIVLASLINWLWERKVDRTEVALITISAVCGSAGLALFIAMSGSLGETITLTEARTLPIFQQDGRTSFFADSWQQQLLCTGRGGALPRCFSQNWLGVIWVCIVLCIGYIWLWFHPKGKRLERLALGLLLAGAILFILAYVVAFKAHLPSRYRRISLDVLVDLSLFLPLSTILAIAVQKIRVPAFALAASAALIGVLPFFPKTKMIIDPAPLVSAKIRAMPKDTLVAGVSFYLDSVPALTLRPIFASLELAVPYKREYYQLIEYRMNQLAMLLRGPVDAEWVRLLKQTGIDVFIQQQSIKGSFGKWSNSFPVFEGMQGNTILEHYNAATMACSIGQQNGFRAVDAHCFANATFAENKNSHQ